MQRLEDDNKMLRGCLFDLTKVVMQMAPDQETA